MVVPPRAGASRWPQSSHRSSAPLRRAPMRRRRRRSSAPAGIEEIVVTATRREEALQDVPLSVTALTSDGLENRGIQNIGELSAGKIPGFVPTRFSGGTTLAITVRGVGLSDPTQGTVGDARPGLHRRRVPRAWPGPRHRTDRSGAHRGPARTARPAVRAQRRRRRRAVRLAQAQRRVRNPRQHLLRQLRRPAHQGVHRPPRGRRPVHPVQRLDCPPRPVHRDEPRLQVHPAQRRPPDRRTRATTSSTRRASALPGAGRTTAASRPITPTITRTSSARKAI